MRVKVGFSKDMKKTQKSDQIINIKNGEEMITIRGLRFLIPSDIEEVLITSLLDDIVLSS